MGDIFFPFEGNGWQSLQKNPPPPPVLCLSLWKRQEFTGASKWGCIKLMPFSCKVCCDSDSYGTKNHALM